MNVPKVSVPLRGLVVFNLEKNITGKATKFPSPYGD